MALSHIMGLLGDPAKEWETIRDADYSVGATYAKHTLIMAALPAVASLIGTTQVGWTIGMGDPVKLTMGSAVFMTIAYYFAMIFGTYVVGVAIKWMGSTYCNHPIKVSTTVALASFTATPLYMIGLVQIFPVLWVDLVLGLPALAYTVYLFYLGVPIMLGTDKDRGFLFATAAMGFGMVALVALLAITALLWGAGLGPQFTS